MKKKAFTLFELIVVMSLIGILAAITSPSIIDFKKTYQFSNSIEILDTYLSQGFSESRSHSENIEIQGEKEMNLFSFKGKPIQLFGDTIFENDFEIEFQAPFGDISSNSSESIQISNGAKVATFSIYKSSGLIDIKISKKINIEPTPNEIFQTE